MRRARHPSRHRQTSRPRGAALLVAMVLLTVVATLSAGMVWQQWRAIQVEAAERSRSQSAWILMGALDWARLILREQRLEHVSLNDTWAQPLAEARLSTFLAADRDNNADTGPEAFLSGHIVDAQSRYNLRWLVQTDPAAAAAELKVLERLCQLGGLPASLAGQIAQGLKATAGADASTPLAPVRLDDLAWLGLDSTSLAVLRPWVLLMPATTTPLTTPVNLNTAPREVLAAVVKGIDLGLADSLVQARQRTPFRTLADVENLLPAASKPLDPQRVDVKSAYFEVHGRLRLEERVLEELSLVHKRSANEVVTLQRQRRSTVLPSTPG